MRLKLMCPDEQEGLLCAGKGVRVMVLRLAPYVWGNGGSFFIPLHLQAAHDKGKAFYILPGEFFDHYEPTSKVNQPQSKCTSHKS